MATPRTTRARGFTLVEMMVTLIIIGLIVATILPSAVALFNAGADSQAKNLLAAQLAAARALAIINGDYAGVHVQMADNPGKFYNSSKGKCFMAVVQYHATAGVAPSPAAGTFTLAEGYSPVKVPGTFAFGEISDNHRDTSGNGTYKQLTDGSQMNDFRSFTIVFSPTGEIVKYPNQGLIKFDVTPGTYSLFHATEDSRLWDSNVANAGGNGEAGVSAAVLFDHALLDDTTNTDAARSAFLKSSGVLLPINVYTGQFFETE